jgi:L-lysine exporter family protein LysE/ArgO
MLHAFIHGAILAFGLIIPLGIQNVFVFNQGATQPHFCRAFPSVLTAFLCDTILILCAVLGVSLIILTIPLLKIVIYSLGFLFLLYMSFVTWSTKVNINAESQPFSIKQQISFAASVSLLNPHAILDTVGVIGTNSLHFVGYDKMAYTLACMFVSLVWFLSLSISGHVVKRIDEKGIVLVLINKFSAFIIFSMALYLGWQII